MTPQIHLQNVSTCSAIPERRQIRRWINAALTAKLANHPAPAANAEITVRVVDKLESATLNQYYRKKHGPTNILSFPFANNDEILGDLVVCAPLLIEEAQIQGKTAEAHWAHLIIHGTLHLLGYDHGNNEDAESMETKEIAIMAQLGYPNPYLPL